MMRSVLRSAASRLRQQKQQRAFSDYDPALEYEFPLRKGTPIITRAKASDVPPRPTEEAAAMTRPTTTLIGSQPILKAPPSTVPPNIPASQLELPKTFITTLENGVRVVSQEKYGQVCTIGVLANMGSRNEEIVGTCHLLELSSFQSTTMYQSSSDIQQALQQWGAATFCHIGREQSLWCLDILRPNAHHGMSLLKETILNANLTQEEVEGSQQAVMCQWEMMEKHEPLIGEAIQQAAYGLDQQLGKRHFCPLEQIEHVNAQHLRDFIDTHVRKNPKELVIAGAGIGHEELVDMAQLHFGHLQQELITKGNLVPSTYRGGECKIQHTTKEEYTQIAIALEVRGLSSTDLAATCVLQTLLGGGASFSAGGPGKGMYSRLYRQVLNRNTWIDSAEAFTSLHGESGLFGITGRCVAEKSTDLAVTFTEHLLKLSTTLVSDEELDRARRMLKNSLLTQLESRLILFEDLGRQVLTYGYREGEDIMAEKLDSVTKEDLMKLVKRALLKPPSVAAVGEDISQVPSYEEIKRWFS